MKASLGFRGIKCKSQFQSLYARNAHYALASPSTFALEVALESVGTRNSVSHILFWETTIASLARYHAARWYRQTRHTVPVLGRCDHRCFRHLQRGTFRVLFARTAVFTYFPKKLLQAPAPRLCCSARPAPIAAGYDLGAGWLTLADRYGFACCARNAANNPKTLLQLVSPRR